jgi:hypothetical protein
MSRITTIEKRDMNRNTIQGVVPAKYCIFEKDGEKFFQIDTYGSPDRKYVEQASQTIQFNRKFAKELIEILIKEFEK